MISGQTGDRQTDGRIKHAKTVRTTKELSVTVHSALRCIDLRTDRETDKRPAGLNTKSVRTTKAQCAPRWLAVQVDLLRHRQRQTNRQADGQRQPDAQTAQTKYYLALPIALQGG